MSPQFGGKLSATQERDFAQSGHFEAGRFVNEEVIDMDMTASKVTAILRQMVFPDNRIRPAENIRVVRLDPARIGSNDVEITRVVWLGHSSFLIEMDGQVILIDPVFSDYAAPHAMLGRKRFNDAMPFELGELPRVDAVLISHDHYDHLDYATVRQLKDRVGRVIVPLGVGNHFRAWGVAEDRIEELDWWEETHLGSITLALTPARHSSGRGLTDQNTTLWGSWCLLGERQKLFFSGDGGYSKYFREIGETYGPFDFGMIECGQYDVKWADVHMSPEESVQAGIDVRAKTIMPIHWGAFSLANHPWTEPVERFRQRAADLGVAISTPRIGEVITIHSDAYPTVQWWKQFN
ncbi:MBL fold metallo-hydrolase [Lewinella sp. JB7]|uniref:MBL fold metallo-hydrolase n=1 Tax=Lewinella sp. JB7 TaxID=2962887 RepID=UPI0020C9D33A|nr:MBL fold metallo-hydrolase [Lewinella sp. JB7]MCP9235232.1 MBL fold metallo-hydrolase [Lewinella sp. JB7]